MMIKFAITSLLILNISSAFAEYRVYQYIVKNKVNHLDSPKTNFITSTLDPTSYLAYNGGDTLVSVDLLRSWICPGNTGLRRETCKSPYKKLSQEMFK